jgi:hypothetical protein
MLFAGSSPSAYLLHRIVESASAARATILNVLKARLFVGDRLVPSRGGAIFSSAAYKTDAFLAILAGRGLAAPHTPPVGTGGHERLLIGCCQDNDRAVMG